MKISSCLSPFVSGYPRTGFALTVGVIHHILREAKLYKPGHEPLKLLCKLPGRMIAARIEEVFGRHGLEADLIYNDNFKVMLGGPQWLKEGDATSCCFRKYIGVKGMGDFSFVTSHPVAVLDCFEIPCSHVAPGRWLGMQRYQNNKRLVTIRNPLATVISACFSINAIASEYIQRFYSSERDTDLLRQDLASYKLTDMVFLEALLDPYKGYLQELSGVLEQYTMVKWEELISNPVATIGTIAEALELPLSREQQSGIWAKIAHVNLTGAHKHNLRKGHGVVGGWKQWATNEHIDMMLSSGFGEYFELLGYGIPGYLDSKEYTPFQEKVSRALQQGTVLHEYDDEELFGFAFQKSNLNFSRFGFKQYPWRSHTQIERSCFSNEEILMEVSDVAERCCGQLNGAIVYWLENYRHDSELEVKYGLIETVDAMLADLFVRKQERLSWHEAMVALAKSEHGRSYPDTAQGLNFVDTSKGPGEK